MGTGENDLVETVVQPSYLKGYAVSQADILMLVTQMEEREGTFFKLIISSY